MKKTMHSSVIVLGDFNEDFKDNEADGLSKFSHTSGLTQIFREKKNMIPSTRGNARAIDHIFVDHDLIPMVRQVGLVPEEVGFTSDQCGLFIDLSPDILKTKNSPIPPAKARKLKLYNKPKVQEYIKEVTEQFSHHNIVHPFKALHTTIAKTGFNDDTAILLFSKNL